MSLHYPADQSLTDILHSFAVCLKPVFRINFASKQVRVYTDIGLYGISLYYSSK